jgi:putative endonuclease
VKTRKGGEFGRPAEAVNSRKRARMLKAAEAFLYESELGEVDCRFDVIEVAVSRDGLHHVNLVRGAFLAGE